MCWCFPRARDRRGDNWRAFALATVGTAWSAYQARQWTGEQSQGYSKATAAPAMARLPAHARRDLLRRIADGLRARKEDLARAIVGESGKPVTATRLEIDRAAVTFALASEEATRIDGESLPLDIEPRGERWRCLVERIPVGPTGLENSERAAAEILSLPIYPQLADAAVDRVVAEIRRFFR